MDKLINVSSILATACLAASLVAVGVHGAGLEVPDKPTIEKLETMPDPAAAHGPWNGRRAAVVLSYDDGLNVHLDTVIPLLDQHNIQATFYLTGTAQTVYERKDAWQEVAERGHELGNHTMVHPCSRGKPGRDWVNPARDLDTYTVSDILDEIDTANGVLEAIDNKNNRTFAYTCGDQEAGGVSFVNELKSTMHAARTTQRGINPPDHLNMHSLLAYSVSGHSAEDLISVTEDAIEQGGLLVFLFHGVGGEHALSVETEQHRLLIEYLADKRDKIWLAPLLEVAEFVDANGL